MFKERTLDAGGPFPVLAPPLDPSAPPCGHGVFVETRFDAGQPGEITLLVRPADEIGERTLRALGERAAIALALATGRCTPRDARGAELLREHPWLEAALGERLPWLRERARRAAAQRDRTPAREALEQAEPGTMVSYDEIFPADWDLLVTLRGRDYWAVDHHCMNPACPCDERVVELHRVDELRGEGEYVGGMRLNRHGKRTLVEGSSPLTEEVFARVWAAHEGELGRRREEMRRVVAGRRIAGTSVAKPRPGRNEPCPCGSGKKYKRCCAGKDGEATS